MQQGGQGAAPDRRGRHESHRIKGRNTHADQRSAAPRRLQQERPSRIDLIVVDADPLARRLIVEILRKL